MALDLLGLTEDQLLGKTSFDPQWNVIHEDGTPFPGPTHPAPQAIASGQPVHGVVMGVFRPITQSRVWLLVNAHPQLMPDGSKQVVVTFSDITERKHAQAAMLEMNRHLRQSRQQLRRLVALNETTLEKEKRHIAREVHDELGQVLTALRMDLSLAIIRHTSQMPSLLDALNGMKTQVDRAIQGVRNVATSLRPAALDMGLVLSIEWLCQEFARHGGVVCELQAPDGNLALDASRAVMVFRIVQESLNNISKYAQASQVSVSLAQHGNELRLQMRDNGIGFDLAEVAQRGTLGLLGMRERVLVLGGQVEVTSTPGQGTGIVVVIPLDTDAAEDPA
jgi:signal transduction histidine kinase